MRGFWTGTSKFLAYILSRLVLVVVVLGLLVLIFFTAYQTVMFNTVAKDAMAFRAQSILEHDQEYDDTVANRLFTQEFITQTKLNEDLVSADYVINRFEQQTDVNFTIVWPWQGEVKVEIRDVIEEIDYEYVGSDTGTVADLPITSGEYLVTMVKQDNHWKISNLELKNEIVVEEAEPSETPEPSEVVEDSEEEPDAEQSTDPEASPSPEESGQTE